MKSHFINDQREFAELKKLAESLVNANDTTLQKAKKLATFVKSVVKSVTSMGDRKWYDASAYETLTRYKVGNCKNFATTLIALCYALGIDGRYVYINGTVRDTHQGHVLCELNIDKWIVFDVLYEVPHDLDEDLPSAYQCWKNPKLYIHHIDPLVPQERIIAAAPRDEFWRGIWYDLQLGGGPNSIRTIGKRKFLEKWYPELIKGGS